MNTFAPPLYFIGDSPLSFEPEIATLFLQQIAPKVDRIPQFIDLAALRRVLWTTLDETSEPALFKMHQDRASFSEEEWINRGQQDPFYFVDRHYAESEVVWRRGVLPWLECSVDRALPTLMESVGILPQYLAAYEIPHHAVFVGTTKPANAAYRAHVEEVRSSARDHWMRTWSDKKIDTYLNYILPAYGTRLQELCHKHSYQFFDYSASDDYKTIQQQAAAYLAA